MTKAQGSARAARSWRQLEAQTATDTRHEDRVDDTLARYYAAAGRAERIRVAARRRAARMTAVARRKAAAVISAAERDAATPDSEAHTALRALHDLVGGKTEVAELCGLTVRAVTDALVAPVTVPASAPVPASASGEAHGDGAVGSGSEEENDDAGQ
jgi:hypothetical protein